MTGKQRICKANETHQPTHLVLPALVDADDLEPLRQPVLLVGHPAALRPRPRLQVALGAHVQDGDDVVHAHPDGAGAQLAQGARPEVGLHLDGQRPVAVQRVDARLREAELPRVEGVDDLAGVRGCHGAGLGRLGRDYSQLKFSNRVVISLRTFFLFETFIHALRDKKRNPKNWGKNS